MFFTKYVLLQLFEVKFGEVSKNKKKVAQERIACAVIAVDTSAYKSANGRYTSMCILPSIMLALRKRSKQVIGKYTCRILTVTAVYLILLFHIFPNPRETCKTWPSPPTSFAIHYLSVVMPSAICGVKY